MSDCLVVPIIDFGANKHIYSLYLFAGFIRIMKQLYSKHGSTEDHSARHALAKCQNSIYFRVIDVRERVC